MFGELNEKQAEYLKDIHASGTHLLSLINATTFTPERFADYLASKSSDTTEIESRRAELEHLVAVVIPGLAQQQERLVDAITSGVALDIVRDRLKKAETDRKGAEARRDELEAWRRDETADREQAEELRDDHPRR